MRLDPFRSERDRRTAKVIEILRRRADLRRARGQAVPPALRKTIAEFDRPPHRRLRPRAGSAAVTIVEAERASTPCVRALLDTHAHLRDRQGRRGKTTVAAALGLAAAARGSRAIVCDLAGSDQLARAFGRPAGAASCADPAPVVGLARPPGRARGVAPPPARRRCGGRRAHPLAGVHPLRRRRARSEGASHHRQGRRPRAAPGLRRRDRRRPLHGHALGMLAAPRTRGRRRADRSGRHAGPGAARLPRRPRPAGYVGVTLPEEMAVEEVLDLERDLPDAIGRELDLIVVNGLYPDRFSDEEAERLQRRHRALAGRSGPRSPSTGTREPRRSSSGHCRSRRTRRSSRSRTSSSRDGPPEYEALARALSRL